MNRTVAAAVLLGCSAFAASSQSVKEPEFPDVFYALSGGQLLKLEPNLIDPGGDICGRDENFGFPAPLLGWRTNADISQ
jgi:hypothetical protein